MLPAETELEPSCTQLRLLDASQVLQSQGKKPEIQHAKTCVASALGSLDLDLELVLAIGRHVNENEGKKARSSPSVE